MELKESLVNIGLSDGETKVYLALLKLGSVTVHKIKDKTKQHRTTIYDFLEKLIQKGLVNYVVKNNTKYYNATNPHKLQDFIKEKENQVIDILPKLLKMKKEDEGKLSVEIYEGKEGLKTLLRDVIRLGEDYVIFGIDEEMFQDKMGAFMDWYFKEQKKVGFKERILTRDTVKYVYDYETAFYRYLPEESFNPTPTYVWGNNVGILIWEPFTLIRIKNEELADSYRKHFELLWNIAEIKPKSAILENK